MKKTTIKQGFLILLNNKNKKFRKNWLYLLVSKPKMYFFRLIFNTIIVGIITFVLSYAYVHSEYVNMQVPAATYSLVAFAIGLLLVFRTSSAYERWSTASKNFNDIQNSLIFIVLRLKNNIPNLEGQNLNEILELKKIITNFSFKFKLFLKSDSEKDSSILETDYLKELYKLIEYISRVAPQYNIDSGSINLMHKSVKDIIDSCGSCTKIKTTPIPLSYTLHIKISIVLYIISLPFGLFANMSIIASTSLVMVLYYIIAGIELISQEIENPFLEDPNDIDMEKLTLNMQSITDRFFIQ